jgi:dolichol-phosphate mannosyltransferase
MVLPFFSLVIPRHSVQDLSFVIPANNEEENLALLLDRLLAFLEEQGCRYEILVVNDGSRDRTGTIADAYAARNERVRVLHNPGEPQGMGYALKWGTREARAPVVVWLMGDLSDDLGTIQAIRDKIDAGFDLVVASRFMPGGSSGDLDPLKSFLTRTYSFGMCRLFGVPIHDMNNAFRGFRREIFSELRLSSEDFAISPEFVIKAWRAGWRIGEVPTVYANRKRGKNKFRVLRMMYRYSLLLRYRLPWGI